MACRTFNLLVLTLAVFVLNGVCAGISYGEPAPLLKEIRLNEKRKDKQSGQESNDSKKPKIRQKEDELLVKYRPESSATAKENSHRKLGASKIREFRSLRLHHVKLKKGMTVEEGIKEYKKDPNVEYAEPDYIYTVNSVPNDTYFGTLWGLLNSGQTGGTSGADIKATSAWDLTKGSSDVVVAVIDSGIDYTHEDLAANIWVNPVEIPGNGIDDDGNGYIDDIHGIDTYNSDTNPMDDHGHGTHVAGTIGALGNNGTGVVGVNWNVRIIACKFLNAGGSGSTSDAVECLQYIKGLRDKGVNIVATNNSWGGGGYSQALYDAINAQRELLFIAAAGNDSSNNDFVNHYPSSYKLPNVISVAASDHNDGKASFSNYGKRTVHVGAPGSNITSLRAAGTDMYGDGHTFVPLGDSNAKYMRASGTSMATPHVTGLAALIAAQDQERDWRTIKNLILSSGTAIPAMDGATITGRRINAYGALTCVDSPVFSLLTNSEFPLPAGVAATLSVLSINCGSASGPVTGVTSTGQTITLRDDGVAPDMAAGDGIFTVTWTPATETTYVTLAYPGGGDIVPHIVIQPYLPEANVRFPYNQPLKSKWGTSPYTWSIESGTLPPGLTLNSTTGYLTGRPIAGSVGKYPLTVKVRDGVGRTSVEQLTLSVADDSVSELWSDISTDKGGGSAQDIVVDNSGNRYVTGYISTMTSSTEDIITIKYDAAGTLVWSRTFDSGIDDWGEAIAVDSSGNVYVAGGSPYFSKKSDFILLKYAPDGTLLWNRSYDSGFSDYPLDMALDSTGNIYLTGLQKNTPMYPDYDMEDMLTVKYDSSGNLLWVRRYDGSDIDRGNAIAVDGAGNVYIAGERGTGRPVGEYAVQFYYEMLLLKYDPSGNIVWTRTADNGSWFDIPQTISLDSSGNIYVGSFWSAELSKFNSSGVTQWRKPYFVKGNYAGLWKIVVHGNNLFSLGDSMEGYELTRWDLDGNVAWTKPVGESVGSRAAIAVDGNDTIYFARGFNGGFLASSYREMLSIATTVLPTAVRDISYSQTMSVTGGVPPYSFSRIAGSLPTGLTLNSSTGLISGTPTEAGAYNFTIQVTDRNNDTATADYGLAVEYVVLNTTSLPVGSVGTLYNQTLSASGAATPLSWSVSFGSLPDGLTLAPSTGVISGTPTNIGSFNFEVQVQDAEGHKKNRFMYIEVFEPLVITTQSLPAGIIGTPYSHIVSASGGRLPYRWTVESGGNFPFIYDYATGEIKGTPTAVGTFSFTMGVYDANGSYTPKLLTVTIEYPPLLITTISLLSGTVGNPYSQTVSATGGLQPYTWTVTAGALPTGVILNSATGALSGTPRVSGTFDFTVQVIAANSAGATKNFSVFIDYIPLAVITSSLSPGLVGSSYHYQLTASGGLPPYRWALSSGTLPAGLTLTSDTGVISGMPTTGGSFPITVQVIGDDGVTASKPLTLVVSYPPPVITTQTIPGGIIGTTFSEAVVATGGLPPYTWSYTGNLPMGLSLAASTGIISGTPTYGWATTISVTVTDAAGGTATKTFWMNVLYIDARPLPDATRGTEYNAYFMGGGGVEPFVWSIVSGTFPPGLTFEPSTSWYADVKGTPTTSGMYSFVVQIRDNTGITYNQPFIMTIAEPTCVSSQVRVTSTPVHFYNSVQSAIDTEGYENIQLQSGEVTGDIIINKWWPIRIKGGYDCFYTEKSGYTTVHGNLIISDGSLEVENLVLMR
jgi:subtilisin family serine protease